jgi:UDP-3-O-[3-hydroxymyristoyl] N-acetylglucosamine deacetylase / 3-hydroxyacyl-[acyl-carrier-protein] dehydratase
MPRPQRTIKEPVEFSGRGLFTGAAVHARLIPAPPNSGVVFTRTDLPGSPPIPAVGGGTLSTYRRTTLSRNGAEVGMVEHLFAALHGLGIDNLKIEIDGPEMLGGDGSSAFYIEPIRRKGIVEQEEPKRTFVVKEPIAVTRGDASIVALPHPQGLSLGYTIDYNGAFVNTQTMILDIDDRAFAEELAPARSFLLSTEVEEFKKRGLGHGASPENTLILNPDKTTSIPLRFPDECVRHKILDLLGDLYLAGTALQARIVAVKSGHALNVRLVERLQAAMRDEEVKGYFRRDSALDIREIQKIIPHRYPFLLVDRILEIDDAEGRAVGIKNVTFNEEFFQGHWPGYPVMPGVLQVEAMAQLAGVLLLRKLENTGKATMLLSMDGVKIRRPVVPGDQMRLEAAAVRLGQRTAQVNTRAFVGGRLVAEAQLRFMLVDAEAEAE